jgi:hypothetical protein
MGFGRTGATKEKQERMSVRNQGKARLSWAAVSRYVHWIREADVEVDVALSDLWKAGGAWKPTVAQSICSGNWESFPAHCFIALLKSLSISILYNIPHLRPIPLNIDKRIIWSRAQKIFMLESRCDA